MYIISPHIRDSCLDCWTRYWLTVSTWYVRLCSKRRWLQGTCVIFRNLSRLCSSILIKSIVDHHKLIGFTQTELWGDFVAMSDEALYQSPHVSGVLTGGDVYYKLTLKRRHEAIKPVTFKSGIKSVASQINSLLKKNKKNKCTQTGCPQMLHSCGFGGIQDRAV